MGEHRSVENKGNPSGKIAKDKKDAGRHGDLKQDRTHAGAMKKERTVQPTLGTTGGHSRSRGK